MKNAIAAEFLKLRRLRVLLLAFLVSVAPPAVKLLRALLAPPPGGTGWREFLTSGQEFSVFGLLVAVMLLANYFFTMEYKLNTATPIFTSQTGRVRIFLAKIISLCAVIWAMLLLSAAAQLLFGALAASGPLPGELLSQFLNVTLWYAVSFALLAAVSALPAVLTRRFVLAAVITLGYYILAFPFHAKSVYGCFFMTPVVVAAKMFGSADYIFTFDYRDMTAGVPQAAAFLSGLALAALLAGLLVYRKSDVPMQRAAP
jgi:hypothetical protein